MEAELAPELKSLVGDTLELLGKAIKLEYGKKTFEVVEDIRQKYKKGRSLNTSDGLKLHSEVFEKIKNLEKKTRFHVVHSFAVSLELINACENAYRSYRIRQKKLKHGEGFEERITYVLTSHPTESRSPECISIFTELTTLLVKYFEGDTKILQEEIFHLILLSLKTTVARETKPEIKDEADYIYSIALREEMLLALIDNLKEGKTVFLRTWVGGDKDGHPGVNADVMRMSLEHSRKRLLKFVEGLFHKTLKDLEKVPKAAALHKKVAFEKAQLKKLLKIKNQDGSSIAGFHKSVAKIEAEYFKQIHSPSPHLHSLNRLLFLFPALVVPLELRESSTLIHEAVKSQKGAIWGMLRTLFEISSGGKGFWYARGLVVSTTESASDISAAVELVKKAMRSQKIPIIPLFESRASLENSKAILEEFFQNPLSLELCKKEWASRFEIMLGYSDSAKENGSFFSRLLIRDALYELENFLESKKIIPIFFHGSGGSVARGGGSLDEQVSWWPLSSRKVFKVTLQGEMVYRSFSAPEVFHSQVEKILSNSKAATKLSAAKVYHVDRHESVNQFVKQVSDEYKNLIQNQEFLSVVEKSTPYGYLSELRIGSRPTKRNKNFGLSSLRAIPWVLCWTQIRSLLPIWWGIGTTWKNLDESSRKEIRIVFEKDVFFVSFLKLLAFSLAKVDLSVWFSYLENMKLDAATAKKYRSLFENEYGLCFKFIQEVVGQENILWFRPWLENSIQLRSTMIHPLNMAQLVALEKNDARLLRETVTGVASGMLTTG